MQSNLQTLHMSRKKKAINTNDGRMPAETQLPSHN